GAVRRLWARCSRRYLDLGRVNLEPVRSRVERTRRYTRLILAARSRPRIAESRVTSSATAFRGSLPASLNHATPTCSPSNSQVPHTAPPATTTGEIQPLCLL